MPNNSELIEAALARNAKRKRPPSKSQQETEWARCAADPIYFIKTYVKILDNDAMSWIPFNLWPAQEDTVRLYQKYKYLFVLKARQEGFTWLLCVAIPLWEMIFHPIFSVVMFSQRDDDAMAVLERFEGAYQQLPDWIRPGIDTSNNHQLKFDNQSDYTVSPGSAGGRGRSPNLVLIDEADYVLNCKALYNSAAPGIRDGKRNKLVMLSTRNAEVNGSYFQKSYIEARDNPDPLTVSVFYGWMARPGRTQEEHDRERAKAAATGSLDEFISHFPSTDTEALAGRSSDKLFPPGSIEAVYEKWTPLTDYNILASSDFHIFKHPEPGRKYSLGVDPAQSNPHSDWSVVQVGDNETREQVAILAVKVIPERLAKLATEIAEYYNGAKVLPERNNHGLVFISEMRKEYSHITLGTYTDGQAGWHTNAASKVSMYDNTVKIIKALREQAFEGGGEPFKLIHDPDTKTELESIAAGDPQHPDPNAPKPLSAPEGAHDDRAVAWALMQMCIGRGMPSMQFVPHTGLYPQNKLNSRNPQAVQRLPIGNDGLQKRNNRDDKLDWANQMRLRK